jgi:hypothetical protein
VCGKSLNRLVLLEACLGLWQTSGGKEVARTIWKVDRLRLLSAFFQDVVFLEGDKLQVLCFERSSYVYKLDSFG